MRLDTALACAFPHAPSTPVAPERLIAAGTALFNSLARGKKLAAADLREAMTAAFGGSDEQGAWLWKDAYEAVEIAQILFLRQYFPAMRARAASPAALLDMLARIAALTPTHTRRSEESETFQQFSTPLELGFLAATAAQITASDHVLEPSAGTGMLAIHADTVGATLTLNEIAETRGALLGQLFPAAFLARCNAEQIDDYLPADRRPTVILMNPPFSATLHVRSRDSDTTFRHLRSALQRLAPGGRLVAITGASCSPEEAGTRPAWQELLQWGTIPFSAPISGKLYQRHGTTTATRLTVIDRLLPGQSAVIAPGHPEAATASALLDLIARHVPGRADVDPDPTPPPARPVAVALPARPPRASASARQVTAPSPAVNVEPILYRPRDNAAAAQDTQADQLYAPYRLQSILIDGAQPHPTPLVQSAAMASVNLPPPSYRPLLPQSLVTGGILSEAQLESVIYAGDAHSHYLTGQWYANESADNLTPAPEDDAKALRYRKGWFLGDGTGAGKGRQIAGIILDNWLQGRRRAVWISKSDKLIEDAQRDWSALGQEKLLIVPQDRYRQGTSIRLGEGILFSTYATLRSAERQNKASRIDQLIEWLGADFDGVIIFDEAHAMANAAGEKGTRGQKGPSQQGLAGLRLQHRLPHARIVYVSATGATTVTNLAYAQRLGLWGTSEFPFSTREEFIAAMEASGIASMEVLARALKALGLYAARALSYEGIEVELLEHEITPDQERIYNAYAGAFQIIHQNLTEALEAANITSGGGTLNRNAKAAARSAFESNKQRFFNHLITAMKTPTLLRAIEGDQREGRASVIQLVSTSEALLERRLAQIPAAEWGDLNVDITPREYVLDYLASAFPTQLYEVYSDEDGNTLSRAVTVDGQPVQCREAVARRDALIEYLAALPPVQSALDQIIHHCGADAVAEVTGRNRRIVRQTDASGTRLKVENRAGSANIAETHAFMDGGKNILVFSDAGGTGRSYHADKNARNQRRRAHYLLEAGWRADAAIQGLGRSNRTNQVEPPLFRPIATTIRGEKRFLSTIARRLDSLGAITRGQRQTGGQGMFRAEDNLESPYARSALFKFYLCIYRGMIAECSLERFQEITALRLCDQQGGLLDELPPITTFLNRLLALEIPMQNALFGHFEDLLAGEVEGAIAAGVYEVGLETIRAESLVIAGRQVLTTHPATGSTTDLLTLTRLDRNTPMQLQDALLLADDVAARMLRNAKSGRCAVALPAPSFTRDDGSVETHLRLVRPMKQSSMAADLLADSFWEEADSEAFAQGWQDELAHIPEFSSSAFHLVTGLLLPIWKRLPRKSIRVYRLTTDSGERIIGRVIPEGDVAAFLSSFGLSGQAQLTPHAAWRGLHDGGTLTLSDGLTIKRAMVMHQRRIELTGFTPESVPLLKAKGCFTEIIQWRTRVFIPDSSSGETILAGLLTEHPLQALSSGH